MSTIFWANGYARGRKRGKGEEKGEEKIDRKSAMRGNILIAQK
jgi:hypothetical protein